MNNNDQGNAAGGAHQNAGADVGGGGGGGGHQLGPVRRGIFGMIDAFARLNLASANIRAAVNRIRTVTEVIALVPALRDVMRTIEESGLEIEWNCVIIFTESEVDPNQVMFPAPIRTMELAATIISTSVMWLHSLLQFNSNLRVDGHGPRYRIHCELIQLHFALSEMQRFLDLLFSLEPPWYVYEEL